MYNIQDIKNISFILNDYLIYYNDYVYYPISIDNTDMYYNTYGIYMKFLLIDIDIIIKICLDIKNVIKYNKNYNNRNIIINKIDKIKNSLDIKIMDNNIYINNKKMNMLSIFIEYTDNQKTKEDIYNKFLKKSLVMKEMLMK